MNTRSPLFKVSATVLGAVAAAGIVTASTAGASPAPTARAGWDIIVVNDTGGALYGTPGWWPNLKRIDKFIPAGGRGDVIGGVAQDGSFRENIDFRYAVGSAKDVDGVNVTVRMNGDGSGRLECKPDNPSVLGCDPYGTIDAESGGYVLRINSRSGTPVGR